MDVDIYKTLLSYCIDPAVDGLNTAVWKTVSGTPAIASSKYRLNAAEMRSVSQYLFGEYSFLTTIPAAPTAGDVRRFGLKGVSLGNAGAVFFAITDTSFTANVYDKSGTSLYSQIIPWDADWTNTAVTYRISFGMTGCQFTVVGSSAAHTVTFQYNPGSAPLASFVNLPLFIDVYNANADNMDTTFILLNNIGRVENLATAGNGTISDSNGNIVAASTAEADAVSNTRNSLSTSSRISGFNGTTWDRLRAGITTLTSTLAGWLNTMPWAIYNASPTARTEGQGGPLQADSAGVLYSDAYMLQAGEDLTNNVEAAVIKPLAISTYSWSLFTNFGANATLNVKASAGNVQSLYCRNLNAAPRYIQLHNTATTPAGSAQSIMSFLVPANSSIVIGSDFFGPHGLNFATGIAFAFSTTDSTYTAATAGDQETFITYA